MVELPFFAMSYITGNFYSTFTFPRPKLTYKLEGESRKERLKTLRATINKLDEIDKNLYQQIKKYESPDSNNEKIQQQIKDNLSKGLRDLWSYITQSEENISKKPDNEESPSLYEFLHKLDFSLMNRGIPPKEDNYANESIRGVVSKAKQAHELLKNIKYIAESAEYIEDKLQKVKSAESQEIREKHLEDIKKVLNNLRVNADLSEYHKKTSYKQ